MKVTCAWCAREGRPGSLGEREPLDDPAETHGICRRHRLEVLRGLPSRTFPGVELLVVVSPREAKLYDFLRQEFATVRGVKVILERRQRERRLARQSVPTEQRRVERRVRWSDVCALGYTVVRLGRIKRDA